MIPAPLPFELGASLARVEVTSSGFAIDCRGLQAVRRYDFAMIGEAAEMAITLRDDGGWRLRFCEGTDEVRQLVAELDEMNDGDAL